MKRTLIRALLTSAVLTLTGCSLVIPATSTRPHDARPRSHKIAERQRARDDARTEAVFVRHRENATVIPCKAELIVLQDGRKLDPCAITTPLGQIRGGVFTLREGDFPWYLRWLFWFGW